MTILGGEDVRCVQRVERRLVRDRLARVIGLQAGGDALVNAEISRRVFAGEKGPARDIVVLNAGAGLVAAGIADDLGAGVEAAAAAIDDGRAAAKVSALQA